MSLSVTHTKIPIQTEQSQSSMRRYIVASIIVILLLISGLCVLTISEVSKLNIDLVSTPLMGYLTSIVIIAIIGGLVLIVLYLRQHDTLHEQLVSLRQINLTLQREAESRAQTQETLYRNAERYRVITELVSNYAYSTYIEADGTMRREWMTDSFYTITGYTLEDVGTIATVTPRTHPDDLAQVEQDLQQTLDGKETVSEYRWRIKSGKYIWTRVKRRPIWDETQSRVIRILGAVSDITVEKEAELALRASEERYRIITELISDNAFMMNVLEDGTLEQGWLTPSYYKSMGYSKDDIPDKPTVNFTTHPDDVEQSKQDLERVLAGEMVHSEFRSRTKSGEYRWLRTTRFPIWDDEHTRIIRYYGVAQDITEQKEAELALRASEDRYRKLTELISDYAFLITVDENQVLNLDWITPSFHRVMGYTEDDLANNFSLRTTGHPDDLDMAESDLQHVLLGETVTSEFRSKTKSGQYIWLQTTREPVWDDQQKRVVRYYGIAKDITAQKEAEFALQQNQQRYQDVSQMMSDYAYSVTITEDNQHQIDWIAGSIEKITGIQSGVLTEPQALVELAHPDERDRLKTSVELTLTGQKTLIEYRIIHVVTKEIRWLRISRQPMWDEGRTRIVRVLIAASDITAEKQAEVALRESEERYRLVSELISDYVFSMKVYEDYSNEIDWYAGSFELIMGEGSGQDWQNDLANRTHPEDYKRVMEDIWKTNYGETTVTEYRIINAIDQSIHWIRVSRQPVWDEDHNRVVRVIGAVADITVEKQAVNALRQSEERYRLLADLMTDFVYSLNVSSDNQITLEWHAGSFKEISGVSIEEFNLQTPSDMTRFAVDVDMDQTQSDIMLTLQGETTTSEYQIINQEDHKPRWIRASRYPIWDDDHERVVRIIGATTDITAQKQAEVALRDTEERYRMLTELMTDYCFSVRINGDGSMFREWLMGDFERVMGYEIPYSADLSDKQVHPIDDENYEIMLPDLQLTLKGQSTVAEYQVINKQDNKPRWIRVTRQPIWNKERTQVIRYLGAVKDITIEKEAEAVSHEANQLRQDLEREKGLHELRSRFVAMVTHEFRNPLAAIQSSASILEKFNERISPESRQEKFDRIYGQIDRMTNLLEDLLQIGELEDSGLSIVPRRLDILNVIRDLYAEYTESIGQSHHLELTSSHDKIMTFGDESLLHHALGNIISNAIKYSPADSVVNCNVLLLDMKIVIDVSDEGMGIPQDDAEQLFEAFYRASNVSTQPGTGLGLIIAQRAIELHQGTIDFSSELGKGTVFTITLPQVIGMEGDE